jgi:hypothetical protein
VDAETVAGLLAEHVGAEGVASVCLRGVGSDGILRVSGKDDRDALESVEVRPDGLVVTHAPGRVITFDPGPVVAVCWLPRKDDGGHGPGQFL